MERKRTSKPKREKVNSPENMKERGKESLKKEEQMGAKKTQRRKDTKLDAGSKPRPVSPVVAVEQDLRTFLNSHTVLRNLSEEEYIGTALDALDTVMDELRMRREELESEEDEHGGM